MREERVLAAGFVMLGVLSVQLGAALATELFTEVEPGGAVLLRTVFAAVVLAALWRPAREVLRGEVLADALLFGFVLAGMNFAFFLALDRLPLGIAVTLEFVGPLAVAIGASRRRLDLLWVTLALGGILLLAPGIDAGLDPLGVLFALVAGAFWGAYLLMSTRVGRGPAGRGGLTIAMCFATVLLLPIGISAAGADLFAARALLLGVAVAMMSSALPYVAEMEALRRISAGAVGILLSLEPAAASLVGWLILDQPLASREVAAVALVVAASAGALSTAPAVETTQA